MDDRHQYMCQGWSSSYFVRCHLGTHMAPTSFHISRFMPSIKMDSPPTPFASSLRGSGLVPRHIHILTHFCARKYGFKARSYVVSRLVLTFVAVGITMLYIVNFLPFWKNCIKIINLVLFDYDKSIPLDSFFSLRINAANPLFPIELLLTWFITGSFGLI